ncbi:two-component system, LytTR family, sensor histidine kinase AlgZ [Burkholderiales bacterium]|nr:two-component system, LytTR family, sensor histidine kinase AlgZ [Burkholderiales bacterium]
MHPLLADPKRLLAYVALLLALAAAIAALLSLASGTGWVQALALVTPLCLLLGFQALADYFLARHWRAARRRRAQVLLVYFAKSGFTAFLVLLLALAWNRALLHWGGPGWALELDRPEAALIFAASFMLALFSILAHELLLAVEQTHLAEQRATQSLLQAREAELQMLRAQINPHFLFNSLNSISALTSIDPAAAREMTVLLAQFFRQTLALSERRKIALAQEVAVLECYLAIEKIRFGDKLETRFELEAAAASAMVPPLCLQPLIENAVKHGVRHLVTGGRIEVRAEARAPFLFVAVSNPMAERAVPGEGTGLGLRNVRERLATLFGDRARITWGAKEGSYRVEMVLPLEQEQ